LQKTHVKSSTFFLLLKLSLVRSLLWAKSHKKKWILGGTFNFQTQWISMGFKQHNLK
jgi:hypothetical protein